MMRRYLLGMVCYLLARIRYLYAIAAAVFGISTTFMLYYRPKSVWGRWYLIVTIVMVILCADATLKARNAMKSRAADAAHENGGGSDKDGISEDETKDTDTDMGGDDAIGVDAGADKEADVNTDAGTAGDESGTPDSTVDTDDADASMTAGLAEVGDSEKDGATGADVDESADIPQHDRETQADENRDGTENTVRTVHHPQE